MVSQVPWRLIRMNRRGGNFDSLFKFLQFISVSAAGRGRARSSNGFSSRMDLAVDLERLYENGGRSLICCVGPTCTDENTYGKAQPGLAPLDTGILRRCIVSELIKRGQHFS